MRGNLPNVIMSMNHYSYRLYFLCLKIHDFLRFLVHLLLQVISLAVQ